MLHKLTCVILRPLSSIQTPVVILALTYLSLFAGAWAKYWFAVNTWILFVHSIWVRRVRAVWHEQLCCHICMQYFVSNIFYGYYWRIARPVMRLTALSPLQFWYFEFAPVKYGKYSTTLFVALNLPPLWLVAVFGSCCYLFDLFLNFLHNSLDKSNISCVWEIWILEELHKRAVAENYSYPGSQAKF